MKVRSRSRAVWLPGGNSGWQPEADHNRSNYRPPATRAEQQLVPLPEALLATALASPLLLPLVWGPSMCSEGGTRTRDNTIMSRVL